MRISDLWAIDVHGHYGRYRHGGDHERLLNEFMSADAPAVVARATDGWIERTIVSPLSGLLPRSRASAAEGNEEAWRVVAETAGLLQYVLINPLEKRTYEQARRMLGQGKCVGIKIHPEEHCYEIREHGRDIFAFAAEYEAVVLTHSGERRSLPADFVPFADEFPQVKLILAHIGCGWDEDPSHQVRAVQQSRCGNIFADTSSAKSIMPNLIEWAVGEIGADKVLFGTDTPVYLAAMQRCRIDRAEISDEAKRLILRENALRVFGQQLVTDGRAPSISSLAGHTLKRVPRSDDQFEWSKPDLQRGRTGA